MTADAGRWTTIVGSQETDPPISRLEAVNAVIDDPQLWALDALSCPGVADPIPDDAVAGPDQ
jgi:hypothetical protein